MARKFTHVLVVVALIATAAASAAPTPTVNFFGTQKTPLLFLTTSSTTQEVNQAPQTVQQQTYIFRDGTVLSSYTSVDASTYGEFPSQALIGSLTLERERLQRLKAAIRAAKAGSLSDCSQSAFPSPGNLSHDTVFTWFGDGGRKNTFIVRRAAELNCPFEVYELLLQATTAGASIGRDAPTRFAVPPPVFSGDRATASAESRGE